MATRHVGDLSFGVAAYTKEMEKTKKQIEAFGKVVTATAKKQDDGAKKATAALTKHEIAMRKAYSAVEALAAATKKAKLTEEQEAKILKQLTSNLNAHVAVLGKVKTSAHDAQVAQVKFASSLSKTSAKLKESKSRTQDMTDMLRNLESAAVLAIGPLSGVGARIRSLGAIAGRSSLSLVMLIGSVVATGVAIWKMSAAAINASKVFEASMARFKAATGSMALARSEMNFVIKTSLELGLRIQDTAKAYSRLSAASKGTALEGAAVRKVFLGVAKAAAALRLTQGEVEGAFRAIEQMMSKGSVQAEELRGQLGERLPGAFRLAAEAMEMTTMELGKALKAGEVMAEDFLPRLAKALEDTFGKDAEGNVNSYTGSMNNLTNRMLIFSAEWDRVTGTSTLFIKGINAAASAIETLTGSLEFLLKSIVSTGLALMTFFAPTIIGGIVTGLKALRAIVLANTTAMWLFTAALWANPVGALAGTIMRVVAAIGVLVTSFLVLTGILDENKEELDAEAEATNKARNGLIALDKAAADANAISKLTDDIRDLSGEFEDLTAAMQMAGSADGVELFFKSFQAIRDAAKIGKDGGKELKARAKELNEAFARLGIKVAEVVPTADSVGAAMFRLAGKYKELQDQQAAGVEATEALTLAHEGAAIAAERLRISSVGSADDLKYFNEVTVKVQAYRKLLEQTNMDVLERAAAEREFRNELIATYNATKIATENEKARKDALKVSEKSVSLMAAAESKLADQRERLSAAQGGSEALEYYDKVTKEVNKYRDAIANVTLTEQERKDKLAEAENVFAQILAVEKEIVATRKAEAEATKELTQAEAEHMKAVAQYFTVMDKADEKLRVLRASNKALSEGPESFEYFTNVTSKVMAFEKSLQVLVNNGTLSLGDLKTKVLEFQEALEDEQSWKKITELSNNMANAVGNSLESLLNGTKSLKDSFKDLAGELWNLLLRALILDPIVKSLSAGFTSFMGGGMGMGMGGGGGLGSIFSSIGGFFGGTQGAVSGLLAAPGMFASGGPVRPNSNIIVGEEGPEMLRIGSRGAYVTSNDDMRNMFDGDERGRGYSNTNITVNLPPQAQQRTAQQTAVEVGRIQRQATAKNR